MHARQHSQSQWLADEVLERARAATDSDSACAARALTDAARLLLPAMDRATFGQQVTVTNEVRAMPSTALRTKLLDGLAQQPQYIPAALAQDPTLADDLRARGLLIEAVANTLPSAG